MNMSESLATVSYLGATILFILCLGGLSNQETSRRGNLYGIIGMAIAVLATVFGPRVGSTGYAWLIGAMAVGATIGIYAARTVQMTQMPELVALMHSMVGLAAMLVGFANYIDPVTATGMTGAEKAIHEVEIYVGILIGAVTFSGSVIAFGKLSGKISGNPLLLPARHWINLAGLLVVIYFGREFLHASSISDGMTPLVVMTAISLLFGIHMVMAIGGADMPVVVSMLNSYSGWAAAATGFTLHNNLLIIVGALVGFSGAILSFIMCKAMNRSIFNVVFGGFGSGDSAGGDSAGAQAAAKGVKSASVEDAVYWMEDASKVIIVPGYGMAVSQAQHSVKELMELLNARGVEVKFAIHPVAGRMPGHMNVLLAEADIPYDAVLEMDEINPEFATADVCLVVGANDVVNPAAKTDKSSPIYGMPILEAGKARQVYFLKRSMRPGYSGVDNLLFYQDNTSLVFGDAKDTIEGMCTALKGGGH